jgi:hypothetical protein
MIETIVQIVNIVEEVEEVESPPSGLNSNFETVQDWLFNICDTKHPEKPIATYHFVVSESPDDYAVLLIGRNTYNKDQYRSVSHINLDPKICISNCLKAGLKIYCETM